jgi:methyl-galactoside transport system substrate-binding protein
MKSGKLRVLAVVCIAVLGVLAAAAAFAAGPNIGVLIYKYDDTYISTVRNALNKAFDGKAEITMQDGKGDQATQNDQLDVMISKVKMLPPPLGKYFL